MKEKILCGIGESGAKAAKAAGASKATCSRIRQGKQDFFFAQYHRKEARKKQARTRSILASERWRREIRREQRAKREQKTETKSLLLPNHTTGEEIREAAIRGIKSWGIFTYDEIQDLAQEALIKLMGKKSHNTNHSLAMAFLTGKYTAANYISTLYTRCRDCGGERCKHCNWKGKVRRSKSLTTLMRFSTGFDPLSDGMDIFISPELGDVDLDNLSPRYAQEVLNQCSMDSELYYSFRAERGRQEKWTCKKCRKTCWQWQIHHILPRRVKVFNTKENTALLCRECHAEVEFLNGMLDVMLSEPNYVKAFQSWLKVGVEKTLKEMVDERT